MESDDRGSANAAAGRSICHCPRQLQRSQQRSPIGLLLQPPAPPAPAPLRLAGIRPLFTPCNQHQGRGHRELLIETGWHRSRTGMAVGTAQHPQAVVPGPALGQELLAGIKAESTGSLRGLRPVVQSGPDALQMPAAACAAKQQSAAFSRTGRLKHTLQSDQRSPINGQPNWRFGCHPDTLPRNP